MTRAIKLGLAILLFLASCGSCYPAAFHAWLTATPLTPEQLTAHQWYFYLWFAATVLTGLVGMVVLFWWLKSRTTPKPPDEQAEP